MACWSKSAGAEGLQSFPFLLRGTRGTAKGSVPLHAGVLGGSPLLDVGTWSCLWERRSQKAQAAHGGKVAETAAIPSARRQDLMKKDSMINLLLSSRVGAERLELALPMGEEALGEQFTSGWTFPRVLLTWLLQDLAAWLRTKRLLWEPAALAACHRGCRGLGQASRWASPCYRGAFVS